MKALSFINEIFRKSPAIVLATGFLYLLAGVMELISLAALLPVLLNLFDSTSGPGAAGALLGFFGIQNISLQMALFLVLILMSLRGAVLLFADYYVARLARDVEINIRQELFHNLIRATWSYLLTLEKGKISNVILREANSYANTVIKLGKLAAGILIASTLIISSVFVSWQAFLIFAVAIVPYLLITRFANKKIKESAEARVNEANKISAYIGESTVHLKYIKASGIESNLSERFTNTVKNYAHYFLRIILYKSFVTYFPEVFGVIILGTLVFLTRQYIGANPTDIIFFLLLLFRGYRQLATVQLTLSTLRELMPSYEICHKMVESAAPHQEEFSQKASVPDDIKSIEVDRVSYSYPCSREKTLEAISLAIPSHGIIALAGSSGAGKTTLSDLLLGLLKPQSGEIRVNEDLKLSSLNLQEWRKNIGYVPQDIFLTTGTIRENILFGAEDKSENNLYRAAKIAQIDKFIQTLSDGYDTQAGDLGIRFSGGQKQRIALARAVAKSPKMLILDEATSALDNLTEQSIQEAVHHISQTIPVIVIAHRLSTIKSANKIYMMEHGKVTEEGDYEALMKKKGTFWQLNKMPVGNNAT